MNLIWVLVSRQSLAILSSIAQKGAKLFRYQIILPFSFQVVTPVAWTCSNTWSWTVCISLGRLLTKRGTLWPFLYWYFWYHYNVWLIQIGPSLILLAGNNIVGRYVFKFQQRWILGVRCFLSHMLKLWWSKLLYVSYADSFEEFRYFQQKKIDHGLCLSRTCEFPLTVDFNNLIELICRYRERPLTIFLNHLNGQVYVGFLH